MIEYLKTKFINRFDCYADTLEPSCIPAMTGSKFIEVFQECINEMFYKGICLERKIHINPVHFIQVVENALNEAYYTDMDRWNKIYDFYQNRYLNTDSLEKHNLKYRYYNV